MTTTPITTPTPSSTPDPDATPPPPATPEPSTPAPVSPTSTPASTTAQGHMVYDLRYLKFVGDLHGSKTDANRAAKDAHNLRRGEFEVRAV